MESQPAAAAPAAQPAKAGLWLAIETAGLHGSVALARVGASGCEVIAAAALPSDRRSAQTLAPGIAELLAAQDVAPADLAAVAVAVGPGSFTGLRVGVVTAKTFAYATGAAPIGVDTLDALAEETDAAGPGARLWTALDAHRGELFCARYEWGGAAWRVTQPCVRLTRTQLEQQLTPDDLVVGPVADSIDHANRRIESPNASGAVRVAWRRWLAGEADNAFALAPRYHRPSAAEEKAGRRPRS